MYSSILYLISLLNSTICMLFPNNFFRFSPPLSHSRNLQIQARGARQILSEKPGFSPHNGTNPFPDLSYAAARTNM